MMLVSLVVCVGVVVMVVDERLEESWASLANPPESVMKLMVLQKKEGFIQAAMSVKKLAQKGAVPDSSRTGQWLLGLWLEVVSVLDRDNAELDKEITAILKTTDINLHIQGYRKLVCWLDKKGVKWDVRGGYNKSNIREVSKFLNAKMS